MTMSRVKGVRLRTREKVVTVSDQSGVVIMDRARQYLTSGEERIDYDPNPYVLQMIASAISSIIQAISRSPIDCAIRFTIASIANLVRAACLAAAFIQVIHSSVWSRIHSGVKAFEYEGS